MPITFVDNGAVQNTTATEFTQAYPSAVGVGSLLVATWRMASTTNTMAVSDSVNGSWTQALRQNNTTDGVSVAVFYKYNTAAGTPTVTFTSNVAAAQWITIDEYSGLLTLTDPIDQTEGAEADSTSTMTSDSFTTTSNYELFIVGTGFGGATTQTAGTNYTQRRVTSDGRLSCEDRIVTAVGSYTASTTALDVLNAHIAVATFVGVVDPLVARSGNWRRRGRR